MMEFITDNAASKMSAAADKVASIKSRLAAVIAEHGHKDSRMLDAEFVNRAGYVAYRHHSHGITNVVNMIMAGWYGQDYHTEYRRRGEGTYGDYIYIWDEGECRQYSRNYLSKEDVCDVWAEIVGLSRELIIQEGNREAFKGIVDKDNKDLLATIGRFKEQLARLHHHNRHHRSEIEELERYIWNLERRIVRY